MELTDWVNKYKRLGFSNMASAMILWSLDFSCEAIWHLQFSIELHLKAIWMRDQHDILDEAILIQKLKDFKHNLKKIYDQLNDQDKRFFDKYGIGFRYVDINNLRYLDDGFGYSTKIFTQNLRMITYCRLLLNDKKPDGIINEIFQNNLVLNSLKDEKRQLLKKIMQIGFPNKRKRRREYIAASSKLKESY